MDHQQIGECLGTILSYSALMGAKQPSGELLVPYIIWGDGSVQFFENTSQSLAVADAEAKMRVLRTNGKSYSFFREGAISIGEHKQDVYLFEVWLAGMSEPLQAYQMINLSPFKLIEQIKVLNYVEAGLNPESSDAFARGINTSIEANTEAVKNWHKWVE